MGKEAYPHLIVLTLAALLGSWAYQRDLELEGKMLEGMHLGFYLLALAVFTATSFIAALVIRKRQGEWKLGIAYSIGLLVPLLTCILFLALVSLPAWLDGLR